MKNIALAFTAAAVLAFAVTASANPVRNGVEEIGQTQKLNGNPPVILNGNARSTSWNFPAVSSGGYTNACALSASFTVPGTKQGDICFVTPDFDGGFVLPTEALLSCSFTADTVARVKLCSLTSDGGSIDLPDAGYFVRSIR